jgi:hypothetical protein
MTRLFLDTEFNGFNGELLSLALVPEDGEKPTFYRELKFTGVFHPWVKENVVPHLDNTPISKAQFQSELAKYLSSIGECTIIADWPDDIRYFCESLIVGPGVSVALFSTIHFILDMNLPYTSEVPHHALYDAIGIRESYLTKKSLRK